MYMIEIILSNQSKLSLLGVIRQMNRLNQKESSSEKL